MRRGQGMRISSESLSYIRRVSEICDSMLSKLRELDQIELPELLALLDTTGTNFLNLVNEMTDDVAKLEARNSLSFKVIVGGRPDGSHQNRPESLFRSSENSTGTR